MKCAFPFMFPARYALAAGGIPAVIRRRQRAQFVSGIGCALVLLLAAAAAALLALAVFDQDEVFRAIELLLVPD